MHQMALEPFAEVARARVRPTLQPAGFDPRTFYGSSTLWSLSAGMKILSGNRIAPNINTGNGTTNYLTVIMKFAVVPQYFTPANFSAVVTLTISNGP